ncbi:DEAD/DEAH box helicase [Streptomyces sp. XM4193]|uniref:DEAD/DEAH box helicase n=1 Tax=Streptomyces sp. XM4193 TaxID=2929782 RepID=UPI001FFAD8F5|nr:DEAD/DEAH box helicase [Streptomyces sp. XM4193]MCK1798115.1 DEAD/DEAH box helicase [Streptomyces sp. XM4193]
MSSPRATPAQITALAQCAAVLLPGDPPRTSQIAFWHPDGELPEEVRAMGGTPPLTVALPDGTGGIVVRETSALRMPVAAAVPVLTRARAAATGSPSGAHPAAAHWGAAAVLALQLAARGRLLPVLDAEDHDVWRLAPLDPEDLRRVQELAQTMPAHAHAVPVTSEGDGAPADGGAVELTEPESLLRGFLAAVADGLPRTPAAALAAGSPAYASPAVHKVPAVRPWAQEVVARHDSAVRLSLRIEAPALIRESGADGRESGADGRESGADAPDDADGAAQSAGDANGPDAPAVRGMSAVLQVHSVSDPSVVVDARELWQAGGPALRTFGPRAQPEVLVALRRAAAVWEPLSPLLTATVPDSVELGPEDLAGLLAPSVAAALTAVGMRVHWPKGLVRRLTTRAVVGPDEVRGRREGPESAMPSLLGPDALLSFDWRFAVGDLELTRAELDRLAEADRPLVRLRDQWVLLDPQEVRRAAERKAHSVAPLEALRGLLSGEVDSGGERVEVTARGWPAQLRERLARSPEDAPPVPQPALLQASLRDYQLRGLNWLHQLTSWGLGCCLADDMGLGKTITLIAFHLHRQSLGEGAAGPTLVVCPASLLGNWQREIERFAPGTPVRRFHGPGRTLERTAADEFVLTTYGTMRLDAAKLADADWGLVAADEAQHVKNPFSATAKALRTIPARSRVALTGTPVENNLTELWAILDWATPGLLGGLTAFRRRWADLVEAGAEHPDSAAAAEQLGRLVRPFLLRRRKSDPGVAPELPPKTETDRAVSLTREQAALYEATVREGLAEVAGADGLARRGLVIKLLTSLKQICNHPAQFLKEEDPVLAGRSGKWELFDELLDTLLAEDASVLVFTQYVQLARLLERHLAERGVAALLLHGGTPVRRREQLVRDFQEGRAPVFLLSLKAAGTGLNLTRAEHVIHFDRWWNPAVEAQATDRAHRIGQQRPVQVHRLITEGTIEDRIAALLARKQALADSVLESGEAALTELNDRELAELVSLKGVRGE